MRTFYNAIASFFFHVVQKAAVTDDNDETEVRDNRKKRQLQPDSVRMWPTNDLDFYLDLLTLDAKVAEMVRDGMRWLNDHTCFVFTEVTDRSDARTPYITYSGGEWCQSYVGRIAPDEQIVQMTPSCASVGTVIHETLHTLGFFHEQSRSDRDEYIQVRLENMKPGMEGNFAKYNTSNFRWPYIYGSVMAQSGSAFSVSRHKLTIVANDQKYQRAMGHRIKGTFADARRLNAAYNCTDKCQTGAHCQNGGFRFPKDCSRCVCPEAFTGFDCGQLMPPTDPSGANSGCGGMVEVTSDTEQRFQLGINAGRLNEAHYCTTQFKVPAGKVVQFRMAKESGDWMPCVDGCNWGYIELNPGTLIDQENTSRGRDYGLPGYRDCCVSQIDNQTLKTDSDSLVVTAFAKQSRVKLTVYMAAVPPESPKKTTVTPTTVATKQTSPTTTTTTKTTPTTTTTTSTTSTTTTPTTTTTTPTTTTTTPTTTTTTQTTTTTTPTTTTTTPTTTTTTPTTTTPTATTNPTTRSTRTQPTTTKRRTTTTKKPWGDCRLPDPRHTRPLPNIFVSLRRFRWSRRRHWNYRRHPLSRCTYACAKRFLSRNYRRRRFTWQKYRGYMQCYICCWNEYPV